MTVGKISFLLPQNREVAELGLRLKEASDNVSTNHIGLQVSAKRPIIKKVLEAMASGIDVSPLFGDVVKAASTKDLVQKKLAYMYIATQAERNADLVILAINTFQKDLQDENPFVRGLALRTLCSMRLSDYVNYMLESLSHALGDSSPYVRKTALISVIRVFHLSPKHVMDASLIDQIYNTLRDRDSEVVANGIAALNEMLHFQGGMTMNKKVAHYLLQRFREFNEWHRCLVLNILCVYKPESEEEIFDIMNLLDDNLRHHNSGVQLATVKLFIQLTLDVPEVHEALYERIKEPLLTLLSSSIPEITYSCLEHLYLLIHSHKLLQDDYRKFYRRTKEPSYVTMKKLDLLQKTVMETSAKEIVDEISGYILGDDAGVTKKSIQTIAKISLQIKSVLNYSLDIFIKLLETGIDIVVSVIITVIEDLLTESPGKFDEFFSVLPSVWSSIDLKSPAGPAFLNLLTTIGSSLPESPYILESLIDNINNYPSTLFRVQLLNSTVALFLKRPAECQGMLTRLFKNTMGSTERFEVRERAKFLFRLLKHDIDTVKKICAYEPRETLKTQDEDGSSYQVLPLHEFNTLSIIHGKPQGRFIVENVELDIQVKEGATLSNDSPDFDKILTDLSSESLINVSEVNNHTLSSTISMEAKTFKSCWDKFTIRVQKEVSIIELSTLLTTSTITLDSIECILEENNIMTMASGDANGVMKFFLYAQDSNSQELSLCELKINRSAQASICIKSGHLTQNVSPVSIEGGNESVKKNTTSQFSNFLS
ncbi:12610_t:CDS:10, partial [Acaulospora morrowiae]